MKKGHKHSVEARTKMSNTHKKIGDKPPLTSFWKGKTFSIKHKGNISSSLKNNKSASKGGISKDKKYVCWLKNKRNRTKRQLNKNGSFHLWGDWLTLKAQYDFTCPSCHRSEPEIVLTEDHIIPLSKGGSDNIENIQPLCLKCNLIKNAKTIKYEIEKR